MSRSEQEQQFQQEQKIAQIEKCFENIADDYHFLESLGSLDEMDGKPLGNILQKYGVKNNTEKQLQTLIYQCSKALQRVQKRISLTERYTEQYSVSQQSRFNLTVYSHILINMYIDHPYMFRFLAPIKRDRDSKFVVDGNGNYVYDANIKFSSVAHCLSLRSDYTEIVKSVQSDTCHYSDLSLCGSAWLCAFCAYKIQQTRREELESLGNWCQTSGKRLIMITYTVPHTYSDRGNVTIGRLKRAMNLLKHHRAFKSSMQSIGYIGDVMSVEIRLGKNGWHPHLHIIYAVDNNASGRAILRAYNNIKDAWQVSCVAAGFLPDAQPYEIRAFRAHSTQLSYKNTDEVLAKYINKSIDDANSTSADNIANEVALGNCKKSRVADGEKSVSGFGLLDRIVRYQRPYDILRWVEYALMTKNLHMITWSRGLKAKVGIADKSDADITNDHENDKEPVLGMGICHYALIHQHHLRAETLQVAHELGADGVDRCLRSLRPNIPVILRAGEIPTDEWLVATHYLDGVPVSSKYYRYSLHVSELSDVDIIRKAQYHLRGTTMLAVLRTYYDMTDAQLGNIGYLYDWMADHEIDADAVHNYVDYVESVSKVGQSSVEIKPYVVPAHPAPSIDDAVDPGRTNEQISLFPDDKE
jgi:hypothetical protein